MKTVGFMPRRPDATRAQFRDHYENRHAPLALGKFPFRKYVRNHVVASDPEPVGFDCLSEFWVDDVAEVLRIMAGEIGDIMREDERRFTDQPRISPAVAAETLVAGPSRPVEDGIVEKEILLLKNGLDRSSEAFAAAVAGWGRALAEAEHGIIRLSFDALTPFQGRNKPPCDGILYGWMGEAADVLWDAKAPAGIEIQGRIRTQSIETRFR
jgi:uncharacterized protein (TIGR02118 family)